MKKQMVAAAIATVLAMILAAGATPAPAPQHVQPTRIGTAVTLTSNIGTALRISK